MKHKIDLWHGGVIQVEEQEPGKFVIVEEDLTVKGGNDNCDATALGFGEWNDSVEDLDKGQSDASQCFGISEELRWNEVRMTPDVFFAPSIERLKAALANVMLIAWRPGDI